MSKLAEMVTGFNNTLVELGGRVTTIDGKITEVRESLKGDIEKNSTRLQKTQEDATEALEGILVQKEEAVAKECAAIAIVFDCGLVGGAEIREKGSELVRELARDLGCNGLEIKAVKAFSTKRRLASEAANQDVPCTNLVVTLGSQLQVDRLVKAAATGRRKRHQGLGQGAEGDQQAQAA